LFERVVQFIELFEEVDSSALEDREWKQVVLASALEVFQARAVRLTDPDRGTMTIRRPKRASTASPEALPTTDWELGLPEPWTTLPQGEDHNGRDGVGVRASLTAGTASLELTLNGFPGPGGLPTSHCLNRLRLVAPVLRHWSTRSQVTEKWQDHLELLARLIPHPAAIVSREGMLIFENIRSRYGKPGFQDLSRDRLRGVMRTLLSGKPGTIMTSRPKWSGRGARREPIHGVQLPSPFRECRYGVLWIAPTLRALPSLELLRARFELTEREGEVALLLCEGLSTKRIAGRLDLSWHTARGHVERCLRKLDVSSRSQVAFRVLCR
jgi:DNA-binding CsgD family transcriptional regulator